MLKTQLELVLEMRSSERRNSEGHIKRLKVGLESKVDTLLVVLLTKAVIK